MTIHATPGRMHMPAPLPADSPAWKAIRNLDAVVEHMKCWHTTTLLEYIEHPARYGRGSVAAARVILDRRGVDYRAQAQAAFATITGTSAVTA